MYAERTEAFAEQYKVGEEGDTGIPVVRPPPGSDVYMYARLWEWWPVLELEQGQLPTASVLARLAARLLAAVNINVQVHPGYGMVMTVTPDSAGEFSVVCNEYCGIGHHTMLGKIRGGPTSAPAAGRKADQMATTVEDFGRRTPTGAGSASVR